MKQASLLGEWIGERFQMTAEIKNNAKTSDNK